MCVMHIDSEHFRKNCLIIVRGFVISIMYETWAEMWPEKILYLDGGTPAEVTITDVMEQKQATCCHGNAQRCQQ